jgi:anti-anti-sigma factor
MVSQPSPGPEVIGPTLAVEEIDSAPHRHLVVRGEIDIKTAPELGESLAATSGDLLLIDMTEVSFIDSSGLRVMAMARERFTEEGRTLVIAAPEDSAVVRTMRLAGMANDFEVISRADEFSGAE